MEDLDQLIKRNRYHRKAIVITLGKTTKETKETKETKTTKEAIKKVCLFISKNLMIIMSAILLVLFIVSTYLSNDVASATYAIIGFFACLILHKTWEIEDTISNLYSYIEEIEDVYILDETTKAQEKED